MASLDVATTPTVCVVTLNFPLAVSTDPTMVCPSLRPICSGPGAEIVIVESEADRIDPELVRHIP